MIKADGLAAGKGVTVCDSLGRGGRARSTRSAPLSTPNAGAPWVVVEERLHGPEASLIAAVRRARRGRAARWRATTSDCATATTGPNTGGMGAYSPLPDLSDDGVDDLLAAFHRPILAELARRGTPFRGALYAGLMLTADGPVLLECNARFGDPETQAILPRLAVALGPILLAAARGDLADGVPGAALAGGRLPVLPGATVAHRAGRRRLPGRAAARRSDRRPGRRGRDAAPSSSTPARAGRRRPVSDGRRPGPDGRRSGRRTSTRRGTPPTAPPTGSTPPASSDATTSADVRDRRGARPMIPRYTLPEMGAIWSDVARFEAMLRVELAVARAQSARGQIPPEALAALETRSRVDVERIAEIERTTDHDVIAFVSQVAETVGPEGRYLHLGLTSSDVVDTGLALQLRAAGERLLLDCDRLLAVLIGRARAEAGTVMMGRTHSVHAEPTTFGLKLAGWAFELERGRVRLAAAVDEIATGKISGPVGTYSHLGPDLEAEVLGALGLHADPVSTQIVQRDRHAALLTAIAIIGGSLERFATEIRNLQHTEIGELQEPFRTGQKGSSAMPHKRNPILSERIAGLARLLRGYAHTALEDQPLWHERDISHSSAERVILPDATIVLDYMLVRMTALVDGLLVRSERMRENIARGLGLHASSRVLVALVDDGGMSREDAYAIVQRASLRAADERAPMRDLLAVDPARRPAAVARPARRLLRRGGVPAPRARGHRPARRARGRAGGAHRRQRRRWPMLAESFLRSGKVRDLYRLDDGRLLLVASDRISAFDVVLPTIDPGQGPRADRAVALLVRRDGRDHPQPPARDGAGGPGRGDRGRGRIGRPRAAGLRSVDDLRGRLMICRPAAVIPIEAVVRGYLAGSGWKEYREHGTVCGVAAPGRPARERPPARADLHPGDQGRSSARTTRTSPSTG